MSVGFGSYKDYHRHCERSEATQLILHHTLGCFVVTILAMTNYELSFYAI